MVRKIADNDMIWEQTTPLYQLALIFAKLEYSEKSVVDPMGLIDSLRLNTGDQQDAAEYILTPSSTRVL